MIVDDDATVLSGLSALLQPWGLRVSTLDQSFKFLEALSSTKPDLLILDVEMFGISGIELCQMVRNHPQWSNLPILFLTAHTDAHTLDQVFSAGADDFVSKPVVAPELVTRILNRLERLRLLRNLSDLDPLTGVANRRKFTQQFKQLLDSAAIFGQTAIGIGQIETYGRWLTGNAKVCELLGYTSSELINQNFLNCLHPEDLELSLNYINSIREVEDNSSGSVNKGIELRLIHKAGICV